ncbi:hypothetical protein [Jeotgalibacillus aurantiacus]|uniref:hypothetical protein n=1 Tax=Jeotgalibacillus aurantiacus TaxID=2763266 RepID=UPI001D0B7954|nr:hypothetical protein [Jeotgalibacillus aurantiacus]
MKKLLILTIPVLVIALIAFTSNNDRLVHQPISLDKIEEIVMFQEYYKVENGGGGVSIEHLNSHIDTTEKEAKLLIKWFNSVSEETILLENEIPETLAGVSFEMKNNNNVIVYYKEGIFYVSNEKNTYSFVNNDMKDYFEKTLKKSEFNLE